MRSVRLSQPRAYKAVRRSILPWTLSNSFDMDHLLTQNVYDVKDRVALVTGGGTGM